MVTGRRPEISRDECYFGPREKAHPEPRFGFTKHGHAVYPRTFDHLPSHTAYARFNKRLAVLITSNVGTMTCFWLFCVISLLGLPAALVEAHVISPTVGLIGEAGFVIMVQWVAQSFLQLVLLPSLMVGQNLQNIAADAVGQDGRGRRTDHRPARLPYSGRAPTHPGGD